MPRAVLLPTDPEAIQLLRRMELDRDTLIEVAQYADRERTLCTSNDVRGFDLITINAKAVRGLREKFCGPNWIKDDTDNQAGIRNTRFPLRVIACNFDQNAGNPFREPTNQVEKGSASHTKTRCNGTGWLPGLPDIPAQPDSTVKTWVLGIFSHDDVPLRAELSLPVAFRNRYYTRFSTRIILLSGSEDLRPTARGSGPDRGPVGVVDIAIRRK